MSNDYDTLLHMTGGPAQDLSAALVPHRSHHHAPVHDARAIAQQIQAASDTRAMAQQMQHMQETIARLQHGPPPPVAHPHHELHRDAHGRFIHEPHRAHPPVHHDEYSHRPPHGHAIGHRGHHGGILRHFPVGFVKVGIGAGALGEIEVKPQVRFQGHRLAVASSCARYFNIVDIKVGKDSQLAATGEMPAEAFSSVSVGTQMELDPAPPGIVITLIVRNTDSTAQDFGAVLYGVVEEGHS